MTVAQQSLSAAAISQFAGKKIAVRKPRQRDTIVTAEPTLVPKSG